MRTHSESSKHRRSVQLEFLENRNLLSRLIPSGPAAEVRLGHDTVPIRLTFEGIRSEAPNDPSLITVEGGGQASNLGKYEVTQTHNLVVIDGRPAVINGKATFTLANGDTLTATYVSTGVSVSQDPSTDKPIYNFELVYTTTGGTGRYEGASGTVIANVVVNVGTTVVTATGEGEISSVGSLKRG